MKTFFLQNFIYMHEINTTWLDTGDNYIHVCYKLLIVCIQNIFSN